MFEDINLFKINPLSKKMSVEKFVNGFDKMEIKYNGGVPEKFLKRTRNVAKENGYLIQKGFFNGDVFLCRDYCLLDNKLVLETYKGNFFDVFFKRYVREFNPLMISANALIEVREDIVFAKRGTGKNVFKYKGYWDFPGGFVFYKDKDKLSSCALENIEKDFGVEKNNFDIYENPFVVTIRCVAFGLYYKAKSKLSKENLAKEIKFSFRIYNFWKRYSFQI